MKHKKPQRWLLTELMRSRHHISLATSETEFHATLKSAGVSPYKFPSQWCKPRGANVTFCESKAGEKLAVVCVDPWDDAHETCSDPIQIAAMLVHEATHIFQEDCRIIGESDPSDEFMAYSIQSLSQTLMYAYAERMTP